MESARWVSFSHAGGVFGNARGRSSGSGGSISGGGGCGSGGSSGTIDVGAVVAMLVPPYGDFVAGPHSCIVVMRDVFVCSSLVVFVLVEGGRGQALVSLMG